jgi:hypothetical protein
VEDLALRMRLYSLESWLGSTFDGVREMCKASQHEVDEVVGRTNPQNQDAAGSHE